ncbi:MAG TPA: glycosyltransferase [Gemmatimonadales bacterium]|nr:glycosyltransferase [Gemmatimonadales bacterium]
MRILHLSKFYPPDPGGLEHVVARLAEGAAARGHEVRVVAATGSAWRRDPGKRVTEPPRRGVVIVRLPTHGVVWSQPVAPGYIWAARWPADVVYVHRPHPLADLAALSVKSPLIILHHSDVQRQRALRMAYAPLAHLVARRAVATVVASRANLEHAEDLGPEGRAKARVIPFGVDEIRFSPKEGVTRPAAFPPPSQGAVALFVGRLVSYKGLDVLLRAVTGTTLNVVVVGGGPERQRLEAEAARLGLGNRVVFAGEVDMDELPRFYRAADYFVLPSTTPAEMFGVALLEAMASGKPVLSTALSTGVADVNVPDVTGLVVPPGDAAALRGAMERLAGDGDLRRRMGEAGRKRVLAEFTLDKMIERHLALCEEVTRRG